MNFGVDASTGALLAASGFLLILSISFFVGARLRPFWGLRWFGAAMALTLLRAVATSLPVGAQPWWPTVNLLLAALILSTLYVGLRSYIDKPVGVPAAWLAAGVLVWFALRAGFQMVGMGVMAGPWTSSVLFAYFAVLAARRMRSFSGGAYSLVAFVFIFHPVFVLGIGGVLFGAELERLRAWAVVGYAIIGLGLLMAAMGRLRIELEQEVTRRCQAETLLREANAFLEVRVKDRTAELEDLVSGLESFNRMVSHDLSGPLGGVRGIAELGTKSLQAGDYPRVQRYLDVIQLETDRLGQLVSQLLFLAKVAHTPLERHETELGAVLTRALDTLRLSQGAQSVACVTSAGLPKAMVDPVLLQQVFVNLVGNAIKFAGAKGHPEVHVQSDSASGDIVVEVRDNGPGFLPERAKDLFQPFTRLHGSAVEGHGIGLTIVRRIIERHGGTVWAEGRPGAGARLPA
ncbi:MAG: ATP-binding protein [Pseudomonadota bacterium]